MLLRHFSDVDPAIWRWKNFSPDEPGLACPHCGELYIDFVAMDMIQMARDILGKPIKLNSGHRCPIHNAMVGGAPMSQHKLLAFDINLRRHDRREVLTACKQAGFTTFGFYMTFLHTDPRPGRRWFGRGGQVAWSGVI